MKWMALAAVGLVAASALAPAPAEAQRYGYDRYDRNWNQRGWDRDHRRWDDRRWDRGRHHNWRGRSYVRCKWVRTWHGRERQCWRAYR